MAERQNQKRSKDKSNEQISAASQIFDADVRQEIGGQLKFKEIMPKWIPRAADAEI